ncbi:hypothetical protein [Siphonobacter sp. SORGH_AS_0500]|uniref:hypothetical protein n=1 Tax=Siphonobacter sp. SORGH_AS_0500 TaxID=1864824 RepID=UPI0012FF58CB|nr:hypothetical protein [Siphonobacter sp. SORGH_AS_0500]
MKCLYYFCFFCIVTVYLTSCQTVRNYRLGAGLHAHDLIYQPKPFAPKDSGVHSAWYVGGVYTVGDGYNRATNASKNGYKFGLAQVSRAHSWRNASISYGTFGFIGTYAIGPYTFSEYDTTSHTSSPSYGRLFSQYAGTYHFYGWGMRGSAHLNACIGGGKHVNWRYLGIEWAYSQEYGSLYDIRQKIPNKTIYHSRYVGLGSREYTDNWIVASSRGLTTLALSSELVFNHFPDNEGAMILKATWGKTITKDYTGPQWFNTSNIMLAFQVERHLASCTIGNNARKPAIQFGYIYRLGEFRTKKKRASNY